MKTLKKSLVLQSNLEELTQLDHFLATLFEELQLDNEDQERIRLGMHEGVSNAIRHGNRFDPDKKVKICMLHLGTQIEFEIIDQGEGFEEEQVDDPLDPMNLLKDSGRGIFLMRSYADEVVYEQGGRCLRLIFEL